MGEIKIQRDTLKQTRCSFQGSPPAFYESAFQQRKRPDLCRVYVRARHRLHLVLQFPEHTSFQSFIPVPLEHGNGDSKIQLCQFCATSRKRRRAMSAAFRVQVGAMAERPERTAQAMGTFDAAPAESGPTNGSVLCCVGYNGRPTLSPPSVPRCLRRKPALRDPLKTSASYGVVFSRGATCKWEDVFNLTRRWRPMPLHAGLRVPRSAARSHRHVSLRSCVQRSPARRCDRCLRGGAATRRPRPAVSCSGVRVASHYRRVCCVNISTSYGFTCSKKMLHQNLAHIMGTCDEDARISKISGEAGGPAAVVFPARREGGG